MIEISVHSQMQAHELLEIIEKKVIAFKQKFIVLDFGNEQEASRYQWMLEEIRAYYDLFIILKHSLSSTIQIEQLFSYGIHGICFTADGTFYTLDDIERMKVAKEIFYQGLIFAQVEPDKEQIDQLLRECIIPLLSNQDLALQEYIQTSSFCSEVKEMLKYIPIDTQNKVYSFADKIKLKMLLESIHLRQKLIVKQVEESFSSSGL